MKRQWIQGLTWMVVLLVTIVLVVALGLFLGLDVLVRQAIRTSLERKIGVSVQLESARLGIRDGSLHLRSLVISNPPGFGLDPLLSLPELYLRYDGSAAASNVLRFSEVRLHLESLNLRVDAQGRTNLMELAAHSGGVPTLSSNTNATLTLPNGMEFGGIDRLTVTAGRVSLQDARDARKNAVYDLGLTNRTVTQVTSVIQLLPLAMEVALRGGWKWDLPRSTP